MIGSLKEEVLIAIASIGPDALTADVYDAVNNARRDARGKGLSFAAVFNTITRLHGDKLLNISKGPVHRGKPMRVYTINADGLRALNQANAVRSRLSTVSAPVSGGLANV